MFSKVVVAVSDLFFAESLYTITQFLSKLPHNVHSLFLSDELRFDLALSLPLFPASVRRLAILCQAKQGKQINTYKWFETVPYQLEVSLYKTYNRSTYKYLFRRICIGIIRVTPVIVELSSAFNRFCVSGNAAFPMLAPVCIEVTVRSS